MFIVIKGKYIRLVTLCILIALAVYAIMVWSPAKRTTLKPVSKIKGQQTLIIDAGHGGEDGGASTEDGLLESTINWDIAKRLNELAGFFGIETVMTRDSEEIEYPESAKSIRAKKVWDTQSRLERINSVPYGVLISIHQNKFPSALPFGSQVLYARDETSKAFGKLTHSNLVAGLNPANRRVAAPIPDEIYLMKQASCTAILVECGFLSNPREAELLATVTYRLKLATLLLGSYIQFVNIPSEVIHEG